MKAILTILAILALAATRASAQTEDDDPSSIASVMQGRHDEAHVMRAFPGVAMRAGDVLTVSRNGHPVARFTDKGIGHCDGFETCSVWRLVGEIHLRTEGGKRETYVEVFHFTGEGGDYRLIAADASLVTIDDDPLASPDEHYAAIGETEGESDGYLSIIDWTSHGHRTAADFKSPCEPVKWLSPTALQVVCSRDGTPTHATLAVVKHLGPTWRLDDTTAADEETRKPTPRATFKPFGESAVVSTNVEPSAKDKADGEAYDRESGYERLN